MTLVSSLLVFAGAVFIFIASIGLIRFRDAFSRMHATTKATSFGILLILIGVSLQFNVPNVYLKAMLIAVFIFLTAPLAAHSISQSADKPESNPDMKNTSESQANKEI